MKILSWVALMVGVSYFAQAEQNESTIRISIGQLPELAINQNEGILVHYIQGLKKAAQSMKIEYQVVPYERSVKMVEMGDSDFHAPILHPEKNTQPELEYTQNPLFTVGFVLYTHRNSTFKATPNEMAGKRIETVASSLNLLGLPDLVVTTCQECSLKKVANHRVDGFIFAGFEMDSLIQKKLQKIQPKLRSQMYKKYPVKFLYKKSTMSKQKLEYLESLVAESYRSGLQAKWLGGITKYYENWKPLK